MGGGIGARAGGISSGVFTITLVVLIALVFAAIIYMLLVRRKKLS